MPQPRTDAPHADRLLRISDVCHVVALSKAEIYKRMNALAFPRPVSCGPRAVRWRESVVLSWVQARVEAPKRAAVPQAGKRGRRPNGATAVPSVERSTAGSAKQQGTAPGGKRQGK
jgi:prophage regulatory protein